MPLLSALVLGKRRDRLDKSLTRHRLLQDVIMKRRLHDVAEDGELAATRKLLDSGVAVDQPDEYGRTALMYACNKSRHDVAQLLISRGASVDTREIGGRAWQAIHFACQAGSEPVIRLLLDSGADANSVEALGWTPLGLAVVHGHGYEVAKCLVEHGSDPNHANNFGVTPRTIAAGSRDERLRQLLE